ncbi:glycerophosphoryl diester phosphodiesterase [Bosea sp. BE125]|uniref:glycerophosphodiester phosphodiesterase n=1 Tax=Bosea sp. BE125 TaxID=2817909 RepID=UPI0028628017|nr:glycerophosphodiester phosphodiesterase family protein [Bosea sp. BE125]MDR6872574.1 glycerophosphoryl diester phosphodiesterase [Bosea sp. BE125]
MVSAQSPASGRPLVIAHRGGALLAPENTAEAFRAAEATGADMVETDLRLTVDGILVCLHDADLKRLCDDPRAVAEIDLATIRRLLPSVMTLQDAIAASAPLGLLLDVKLTERAVVSRVLAELSEAGAVGRIVLGLRDLDLIAMARAQAREVALLAFAADPDSAAMARAAGADWFRLWQGDATAERAAAVRAEGLKLAVMVGQPRSVALPDYPPFPVGRVDRDGLDRLLALSPDAILLDDPRLLVEAIAGRPNVTGLSPG